MTYLIQKSSVVGRKPPCRISIFIKHSLLVAVVAALTGCATADRAPDTTPQVQVPENLARQIDSEIGAASLAAVELAKTFARNSMERWRNRVYERTDTDFIPWLTAYWTQQWLEIKMAWFKLNAADGTDMAPKRLAGYLNEQYYDRVLYPVAKEIDPFEVKGQATKRYLQALGEQLRGIPRRDAIPIDQFDRRLEDFCVITLAPRPAHSTSLAQLIHADPMNSLPAYVDLNNQIRRGTSGAGSESTDMRLLPVANRAGDKLMADVAVKGGASLAAIAFGGVAGMMISLGAAGYGAIAHESERLQLATQLRNDLNIVVADMWIGFMEDGATGVMEGVYHVSEQIDVCLAHAVSQNG